MKFINKIINWLTLKEIRYIITYDSVDNSYYKLYKTYSEADNQKQYLSKTEGKILKVIILKGEINE